MVPDIVQLSQNYSSSISLLPQGWVTTGLMLTLPQMRFSMDHNGMWVRLTVAETEQMHSREERKEKQFNSVRWAKFGRCTREKSPRRCFSKEMSIQPRDTEFISE